MKTRNVEDIFMLSLYTAMTIAIPIFTLTIMVYFVIYIFNKFLTARRAGLKINMEAVEESIGYTFITVAFLLIPLACVFMPVFLILDGIKFLDMVEARCKSIQVKILRKLVQLDLLPQLNSGLNYIYKKIFKLNGKKEIVLEAPEYVFKLTFDTPYFKDRESKVIVAFHIIQEFKNIVYSPYKYKAYSIWGSYFFETHLTVSAFKSFMKIFYYRVPEREELFEMHREEILPLLENFVKAFYGGKFPWFAQYRIKRFSRHDFSHNFVFLLLEHAGLGGKLHLLDELFVYYRLAENGEIA
jgi:hypothetical protein